MVATKTRVIIVEDDPSTREFLVRALAKRGIETIEAATAGEALVALEREPMPSSVVLDMMLPDTNGAIVLHRIRRKGLPIRVAVVTGMADPSIYLDDENFSPDRIFKKPLNLAALIAWVEEPDDGADRRGPG